MSRRWIRADPEAIEGKRFDWKLLPGILRLVKPHRSWVGIFVFFAVTSAVAGVLPPLIFRSVIDHAIPQRSVRLLTILALEAIGLYLANSLLDLGERWASSRLGSSLTFDLRVYLYDHLHRLPMAFFTRSHTGALMSRVTNDVLGAQDLITDSLNTVTTSLFSLMSTIIAMFALDWRLTLVVLVAIPGFIIPTKYFGRILQRLTRDQLNLLAEMNTLLHERLNVSGALLAQLYGSRARERELYRDTADPVRALGVRTSMVSAGYGLGLSLFMSVSTSIVYWVGGAFVIRQSLTLGTMVAFATYARRAYQPANDLASTRVTLMTAAVSFERVFEVLNFPNPVTDRAGAVDLVGARGEVEFDHVSFSYPTAEESTLPSLENPGNLVGRRGRMLAPTFAGPTGPAGGVAVLHDVSFRAGAGEMVALVGPTGAGKSTTLSLVPRLYDPTAGAIRVDGHDLRDLTLDTLRAAIGVVTQDPHLFHDTIANNLRYARPEATDNDLEEACRTARIHDLIASLPEGYETVCGERGYRLSGGEKQRLAIARMLLKDPAIVILDEATAHLDSRSEQLIKEALADALAGRTTLVIAHRLSTIVAADRIVVIDNGRITQQGTHTELVANTTGLYHTLYQTQYAAALTAG